MRNRSLAPSLDQLSRRKRANLRLGWWRRAMNVVGWPAVVAACGPLFVLPPHAMALPEGGRVVAGDVHIAGGAGQMDITQLSQAGIINWADFNIGAGEVVNILQNDANAALLNRVVGANPSELLGQLKADGRVYLVNPNGLLVGVDARIDAGSFLATTAQIGDDDFMVGESLRFSNGTEAGIVNLGIIEAADGDAVLVAYRVVNEGEIRASEGTAALGAATEFVYAPTDSSSVLVVSEHLTDVATGIGVDNAGLVDAADAQLTAANGNLYELAVNQEGIVRATGVSREGGRVLLTALGGSVNVTGEITARAADGSGGEVLVGGDYQGRNAKVPTVDFVTVGAEAVIDVAGDTAEGNGGRAIIWADQQTDFSGRIDGRAGEQGGDGAFTEVSGKQILNFKGLVDLTAPAGRTGDLLLDPNEAIISAATDDQLNGVFNTGVLATNLGTANVIVNASTFGDGSSAWGNITVSDPVAWSSGNTLTLKAGDNINVNADLTGGSGSAVSFELGASGQFINTTGDLNVNSAATVTADTVTIRANPDAAPPGNGNVPNSPAMGAINFNGVLNTTTLDIALNQNGVDGDVSIANAGNAIGRITTSEATDALINGDITIVDSSGDLSLEGNLSAFSSGVLGDGMHPVSITTPGDLTLASGAKVATDRADIALVSTGGSFINQAGGSAIVNNTSGRTLIYSDNPTDTNLGGLTYAPVYNKTFSGNAPGTITQTGNRILYSLAPTLRFTADDFSRAYGSANPVFTFGVSGLVGGDTAAQAYSGTPSLSSTATNTTDAGVHQILSASGSLVASDYDYQIAFSPGSLTINQVPLTVTAANAARIYGDANPIFTGSITGFVLGQDASVIDTGPTYGTTAVAATDVGSYAITGSGGGDTNYSFTYVPATLTVNPAALTITADNQSRDYGDANPVLSVTYAGFKNSDSESVVSGLNVTTPATAASDVGTFAITPAGGTATNYTITHTPGTLTVDPAAVTVTANDETRTYGGTNPTFTGNVTGLKLGQDASALTNLGYASSATTVSAVGTYAITPGGSTNANYAYTYTPGVFSISQAALSIAANNAAAVFNEALPAFSASFTGLVAGDTAADIAGLSLTTAATQGSGVGTYAINASGATNPNYAISFTPGTLTISSQVLTISADDLSRTYGSGNPVFTASTTGFVGSDDVSIFTNPISFATTAITTSDVGTYTITPSGATAPNYDIVFVPGTLTVNPAALSIAANSFSRIYGDPNPAFTATFSGLVAGDTTSEITGLTFTTPAVTASDTGTYAITPGGASNANYTITDVPGTLTVDSAQLTVTLDDQSREYGEINPTLSTTITGFKLSDDASVLSGLAPTTAANATSDAGNYTISNGFVTATNYAVTVNPGTLSVAQAPLTISAEDKAKVYGDANPALTNTTTGFKLTDDASVFSGLSLTTSATTNSNIGTFAITPAGATATNYAITFVPGELTISAADLFINADSLSRDYGSANPTLTATITGLKAGDTAADIAGLLLSTTAAAASDVGSYAITATGATNANYTITHTPGTLTVDPAALTITSAAATKVYADLNPTLTASVSGLVLGHTLTDVGALAVTTSIGQFDPVGSHDLINASFDSSTPLANNYAISFLPGTFTITPRAASIVVGDSTRLYGDANSGFTFSVSGTNPPGTTLASRLDTSGVSLDSVAVASSDIGTYSIIASGVTDSNFDITFVPGTLTVDPAPLNLSVNSISRLYGADNPAFTTVVAGLKLSDTVDDVLSDTNLATTAILASNVGTYPITVSGTAKTSNYDISFTSGTLTLNKAPLAVAPAATTRFYGDANPEPALSVSGLLNGDSSNVVSAFVQVDANIDSPVGNYDLTLIGAAATNYEITTIGTGSGTLVVLPRPLTIAADSFSRLYGDANPVFNGTIEGLASFDDETDLGSITYTTLAHEGSGVGAWGIVPGGASNPNYVPTFVAGQLTINPAPLEFNFTGLTRVYGGFVEEFEIADISGIKNDDTLISLQVGLDGPALTAGVGTYDVVATVGNPNYEVTSSSGTLEVTPAPLFVAINSEVRDYGDPNSSDEPTIVLVNGLLFGDQIDDVFSVAYPGDETLAAGVYGYTTELLGANYTLESSINTLTVNRRSIVIKPANDLRIYGDAPIADQFLIKGDGLAPFHSLADLGDLSVFVRRARDNTIETTIGTYQMDVSLAGEPNPNYLVQRAPGLLVVAPRPISISVFDSATTENLPLPEDFDIQSTSLASFHALADVFLDLDFDVLTSDGQTRTYEATDLDRISIPVRFSDEGFSAPVDGDEVDTPELITGSPSLEFSDILIADTIDLGDLGVTIDIRDGLTISTGGTPELTEAQREAREPLVTYFVRAKFGLNRNYVLVGADNGQLDIFRDPAVIAAIDQAEIVRVGARTGIEDFLNPTIEGTYEGMGVTTNAESGIYGLPTRALPALVNGLRDLLSDGGNGDSVSEEIYEFILGLGELAGSEDESEEDRAEFALGAFLAAVSGGDTDAMALMGAFMSQRVKAMIGQDYADLSSSEKVLYDEVSIHLGAARTNMAERMREKHDTYFEILHSRESGRGFTSDHFMRTTPYADFMGESAGDLINAQQERAAGIGAATAAGGTAVSVGAGVGIAAASAVIFPYASFGTGGSILAGGLFGASASTSAAVAGTAGGSVAATVGVVLVPVIAIGATIAMSVTAAVVLAEEVEQKALYDEIQASAGSQMYLEDLNLEDDKGEPNSFDQALLLGALASLMGGDL